MCRGQTFASRVSPFESMRISIPGIPGVYYDTDAGSTAMTVALTAAGRKAPKPQGYAVQALPYLWSFDVDLREVPDEHPLQYLHPEGAHSLDRLTRDRVSARAGADVGANLDSLLRFVWAVNEETETALESVLGRRETEDGLVIEIEDGPLPLEDSDAGAGDGEREAGPEVYEIEVEDESKPDEDGA